MAQKIKAGCLLIAEPYMPDERFSRSVIIIASTDNEGVIGYVLNQPIHHTQMEVQINNERLKLFSSQFYLGGPVEVEALSVIHSRPDIISGSEQIGNSGVYWGGDMGDIVKHTIDKKLQANEVKFFAGYSGWGKQQLENEIALKSWFVSESSCVKDCFSENDTHFWKEKILHLGKDYQPLAHLPKDIRMN